MLPVNEKIRASEVELTDLDGTKRGIVPLKEALAEAKRLNADLVCTSLMSSPPPCKLVPKGTAGSEARKAKETAGGSGKPGKVKEIRLTPGIEDHDYETKRRQAEKLLAAGNAVQLVVKAQGKEGQRAKAMLERLAGELAEAGEKETGIQVSGKGAAVRMLPRK